jgi:hypothetical protein
MFGAGFNDAPLPALFGTTFLGNAKFPTWNDIYASSVFEGISPFTVETLTLTSDWRYGGFEPVGGGNGSPFAVSYSGTFAVGKHMPQCEPLTVTSTALVPSLSDFPFAFPSVSSTETLSLWNGFSLVSLPLDQQNATIWGVDDFGTMVGLFPDMPISSNAPANAIHAGIVFTRGSAVDFYSLIDEDYVPRIKIESFINISSDGKVLLTAEVLEGNPAKWASRQLIFDSKSNEVFVVLCPQSGLGDLPQYINSDKWLGLRSLIQGASSAVVLRPVQ